MVSVGESFKPHPETRKLYYVYLLIPALVFAAVVSSASVAILLFATPPESWLAVCGIVIPYFVALGLATYWVPRYLSTVTYLLTEDRVVFEGGLWWKRKSYVPYNRITNIDVLQGPLSRRFGLGKVSIQTAGYSGQSSSGVRLAEIAIFGVKDFESIKDTVMRMATKSRPIAVEAGVETTQRASDEEILEELRRIRKGIDVLSAKQ